MKLNFFRWPAAQIAEKAPRQDSNPTLIFLHGSGGTGQIWRPITASLESEWNCIGVDQRGHGGSRPVPLSEENAFHATDYAKDVFELIQDQAIESCFIIGHSMGVRTALALAPMAPDKIKGVVALDLGMSRQWGGGMGIALSQFIQNLPESFPNRETMKNYLFEKCPDLSIAQYLHAVAKKTSSQIEEWKFPFDHSALVKTIEQAHEAPVKDWLLEANSKGVPFLFLHGQTSKVWSLADYECQKAELESPTIQFESWENTGHGLPFEQRVKFVERLKQFIA